MRWVGGGVAAFPRAARASELGCGAGSPRTMAPAGEGTAGRAPSARGEGTGRELDAAVASTSSVAGVVREVRGGVGDAVGAAWVGGVACEASGFEGAVGAGEVEAEVFWPWGKGRLAGWGSSAGRCVFASERAGCTSVALATSVLDDGKTIGVGVALMSGTAVATPGCLVAGPATSGRAGVGSAGLAVASTVGVGDSLLDGGDVVLVVIWVGGRVAAPSIEGGVRDSVRSGCPRPVATVWKDARLRAASATMVQSDVAGRSARRAAVWGFGGADSPRSAALRGASACSVGGVTAAWGAARPTFAGVASAMSSVPSGDFEASDGAGLVVVCVDVSDAAMMVAPAAFVVATTFGVVPGLTPAWSAPAGDGEMEGVVLPGSSAGMRSPDFAASLSVAGACSGSAPAAIVFASRPCRVPSCARTA